MPDPTTQFKPSTSTVTSVAIGAPAGVVVVWMIQAFGGIEIPTEVATAIGALVSALVGYFFVGGRSVDTQD